MGMRSTESTAEVSRKHALFSACRVRGKTLPLSDSVRMGGGGGGGGREGGREGGGGGMSSFAGTSHHHGQACAAQTSLQNLLT